MICDDNGIIAFIRTADNEKVFVAVNLKDETAEITSQHEKPADFFETSRIFSERATLHGDNIVLESGGYFIGILSESLFAE